MSDLIARLEAAEAGSHDLDEAISLVLFPQLEKRRNEAWYLHGTHVRILPYTTSLDAALSLVPADWRLELKGLAQSWFAALNTTWDGPAREVSAFKGSAPLALCIAALEARKP